MRRHSDSIMRRHMLKKLSPANVFASALEMQDFVQHLPGRLNAVLDNLAGNKIELKVDAFDETRLMDNLQKIANRIALGLVLAALIVGAALMMQVRTPLPPLRLSRASPCCSSCWPRPAASSSSSASSSTTTGGSGEAALGSEIRLTA